ncbi:MAG: anaerobic ribonucleoside-triphosphate reductase activating protein [Clostridia bacterium]|nr:anaerobic ribonucleoside-triphosphate reductase activating protein [Clostridia bacterium]
MNYAKINKNDIANGIGIRVTLFVSGCTHYCKGCFNKEAWDFDFGQLFDEGVQNELLEALNPSYIGGLTLLGGEPMEPQNQRALLPFLKRVKEVYKNKTVWCYSGYTFEELTGASRARCEVTDEVLSLIDILVDGEFQEELKDISLRFKGSSNQRIIDMNKTRNSSRVILWNGEK